LVEDNAAKKKRTDLLEQQQQQKEAEEKERDELGQRIDAVLLDLDREKPPATLAEKHFAQARRTACLQYLKVTAKNASESERTLYPNNVHTPEDTSDAFEQERQNTQKERENARREKERADALQGQKERADALLEQAQAKIRRQEQLIDRYRGDENDFIAYGLSTSGSGKRLRLSSDAVSSGTPSLSSGGRQSFQAATSPGFNLAGTPDPDVGVSPTSAGFSPMPLPSLSQVPARAKPARRATTSRTSTTPQNPIQTRSSLSLASPNVQGPQDPASSGQSTSGLTQGPSVNDLGVSTINQVAWNTTPVDDRLQLVLDNIRIWTGSGFISIVDLDVDVVAKLEAQVTYSLTGLTWENFRSSTLARVNKADVACVWQRVGHGGSTKHEYFSACSVCVKQKRLCLIKLSAADTKSYIAPLPELPQGATSNQMAFWVKY
jgi:hypothetical protein